MVRRVPYILLTAVLVAADLLTKRAVFERLDGYAVLGGRGSIPVVPGFFRLVAHRNPGITWGLGQSLGGVWTVFNVVALVVIGVLLFRTPPRRWLRSTSLVLVLAGALGNLYDRLLLGWVRDFALVYVGEWSWPAFNVADAAIVVGVILLAAILWRTPAKSGEEAA